jgi:hypothetical protein
MIVMSTLNAVCENPTLHQIHRSKISLHRAKVNYSYPTIRLPHTFSVLAGLPAQIFQTVHDGALAFLVVVSSSNTHKKESMNKLENPKLSVKSPRLDMAEVAGSNPAEPIGFWLLWSIKASCGS